jgi:hypothetical protein
MDSSDKFHDPALFISRKEHPEGTPCELVICKTTRVYKTYFL